MFLCNPPLRIALLERTGAQTARCGRISGMIAGAFGSGSLPKNFSPVLAYFQL